MNVIPFPHKDSQQNACPTPSGVARSVMAICGGDFSIQQAGGPISRISWADDELARKMLFVIDEIRHECGSDAQYAIDSILFNRDGSAVSAHLDIDILQSEGGEPPCDMPWLTKYQGEALMIHATAGEAAA